MKKLSFVYTAVGAAALFILLATAFDTTSNLNGPPAGRCGDPASGGLTCAASGCHTGNAVQTVTGWITSNIPAGGYTAGQTYTVTATATQAAIVRFGFQVSPQSSTGALLGTLGIVNATETQLVGSGKYIEHKSAGSSGSGSRTWTFNWTAPASGTGDVTFYGAFNCANNNGNSTGDHIFKTTYTVSECQATAQITSSLGNAICASATTTLQANSGSSYLWSNGSTASSINAGAGTYNVTVTQSGGCSATSTINVTSIQPPTLSLSPVNTSCGNTNGGVSLNVTSGAGPFTYSWSNGASTQNISNVAAGAYSVTVNNSSGCSTVQTSNVGGSTSPSIDMATTNAACGQANGTVMSAVTGGTPAYTYVWSNNATTPNLTGLSSDNYTLTVTDANGCTDIAVASISDLEGPQATANVGNSTCGNGFIAVTATNGTPPYAFAWSTGDTADSLSNLNAGVYGLTVTDSLGCAANESYTVDQLALPSVTISGPDSVFVDSTYTYTLSSPTGIASSWTVVGGQHTGQGNSIDVHWDSAGNNIVVVSVTDAIGCVGSDTLSVYADIVNGVRSQLSGDDAWTMYPNPAEQNVSLTTYAKQSFYGVVNVITFDGRVVLTQPVDIHQGVNRFELALENLATGAYFVQMQTPFGVTFKALSVLR